MKKTYILLLALFSFANVFSQSQGISYQAVIISTSNQEIPGNDISGNIIPNRDIMVRFSILDQSGSVEYQEEQATKTDAYGMINLIIGQGTVTATSPLTFIDIDWNGNPKDLKVDISLSQADKFYTDFSVQQLNFIPYAYHKNITATGSLSVSGKSTLQDLSVEATTNLNGSLDVNNASPTNLTGSLRVEDNTTLEKKLTVNSSSSLNGQVVVNASLSGGDASIDAYPLVVKGSDQGIAIKVNNKRSNSTNFVTFWDNEKVQGRIEGESSDDITSDPWFYFENAKLVVETGVAAANLYAAVTATTVCAGLGACVTAPPPSKIVFGIAQVVVRAAQLAAYDYFRFTNAGVVYKSKGADYAEYLQKVNPNESIFPGDIVGVNGGFVSKSTEFANKIMIVSKKPIVLGNLPAEGAEANYEKIAFIGQVEAKVIGKVNIGDYIIPSGNNDGAGIAVSPQEISFEDYLKVAGVAWTSSQTDDINYINVAVGLNTNDVARLNIRQEKKIKEQEAEIQALKSQLEKMNAVLAQLIPNYADLVGYKIEGNNQSETIQSTKVAKSENVDTEGELTIVYFDITKEHIQQGIEMAKEILKEQEVDLTKYTLFTKLDSDAGFRENYVNELQTTIRKKMDECYNRDQKSGVNVLKYY